MKRKNGSQQWLLGNASLRSHMPVAGPLALIKKQKIMEEKDVKLLWMFTLRIGMYTGTENKDTVLSFIHGYEIGRENKCDFVGRIIQSIENEYKIKSGATGWSGQIERLAEELETDWITIFKMQSIKILAKEFYDSSKTELTDLLKRRINGKMNGITIFFHRNWIRDWFGIINKEANWFKEMWSATELKLINEIETELKAYGKVKLINKEIEPTKKLIEYCSELHREMNKNKNES